MDYQVQMIEAVRLEQELRGIATAELARRAGIDKDKLGKTLRGRRVMSAEELMRVLYVLGVPIEKATPKGLADELEKARKAIVERYGRGSAR